MATQKTIKKGIIPLCKIHMVEEETFEKCPKGEGKEELGEEEWVSLNTLSFRKIRIWQDYSTSLELKREGVFFFFLSWNEGDVGFI